MGEPAVPTAAERGHARDLAEAILDGIRNDEAGVGVRSATEIWLLAATLVFYVPILEAAWKVAKHWHEESRCRICRRHFHPTELDEDILRNLGACESCAQQEDDDEYARRAELDGEYDEPDDGEDRP